MIEGQKVGQNDRNLPKVIKKLKFFQKFQFQWHVWPILVVKSNLSCLNGYFEGFWIEFSTHISSQSTFRAEKIHIKIFRILHQDQLVYYIEHKIGDLREGPNVLKILTQLFRLQI